MPRITGPSAYLTNHRTQVASLHSSATSLICQTSTSRCLLSAILLYHHLYSYCSMTS